MLFLFSFFFFFVTSRLDYLKVDNVFNSCSVAKEGPERNESEFIGWTTFQLSYDINHNVTNEFEVY